MSRKMLVIILVLIFAGAALVSYAGNVHFIGSIRTTGGSFVAEGDVVGLESGLYTLRLDAYSVVSMTCEKTAGWNQGTQIPWASVARTTDTETPLADGQAHVLLAAPDPSLDDLRWGCPGRNWEPVEITGSPYWFAARLVILNNITRGLEFYTSWQCSGTPESCVVR